MNAKSIALLFLVGCGPAFTSAATGSVDAAAAEDGGPERTIGAEPFGRETPEAGAAEDARAERGGKDAAAKDVAVDALEDDGSCETPDASGAGTCSSATYPVPGMFELSAGGSCFTLATPDECLCAGRYTCACLKAHDACLLLGAATWIGCDDSVPLLTVTCMP